MADLLDWLRTKYPNAKRQTFKRMLEEGRITINGNPARRVTDEVGENDVVRVERRQELPKASLEPLKIIHEDGDVLVVHKPAGLLTSTVPRERRPTAIAILRRYLADRERGARAGVIHRLDQDAEGLLVFSKNNEAYESLKRQFFEHTVKRVYTAVVHGRPRERAGRIESYLVELADGTVRSTHDQHRGRRAITDWEMIKQGKDVAVLRVTLRTGRKHQIRTHLAERGMPIVGDSVYGKKESERAKLLLAATELAFDHPRTGKRMKFQVAPPRQIESMLQ